MNTDNRLIAEFMGCEHVSGVLYEGYKGITINGLDVVPVYSGENLSYHKSWDWLMPVVEKIQKIHGKYRSIRKNNFYYSNPFSVLLENGFEGWGKTELEATYNMVISYIKWYNQNNKTNEH